MFDQVLCAGSRQRRDRASTNRHHLLLILRLWLLLAPLALILSPSALASPLILAKADVSSSPFLAPAKAFRFKARMAPNDTLVLQWIAAPHYHLYRNRITLQVSPRSAHLAPYTLPPGKPMDIPGVGTLAVYEGDTTTIRVPVHFTGTPPKQLRVTSSFQGCANAGVCYPVITKSYTLSPTGIIASTVRHAPALADTHPALQKPVQPSVVAGQYGQFAAGLAGGQVLLTLLLFFLAGLGLAFTPCIFPMIPILSSLVVGQGNTQLTVKQSRRHAFWISLAYVLGMSLAYTVAGVLAAITGSYLQAFFQNPWVLSGFSALFVVLALSMFGFYELQMPNAIQSRLSRYGKGGHFFSAFVMGVLSALIVGPCVAAPLAGALLFIAHTGNVVLGGLALFLLGLGMGVPLLIIGTSAGHFLPKAGAWMNGVKAVFGVVLLGVAIWFLSRIVPGPVTLALWSALAILSGIFLGAFAANSGGWPRFFQGLGILAVVYGVVLGVGASAGASLVLEPLAPFVAKEVSVAPLQNHALQKHHPLHFTVVRSLPQLQSALAAAKGHPVLVDFWATWCVECQRMDVETYDNPRVEKALQPLTLIRVNVTASDAASRHLLHRFQLFGPPAVLLVNAQGHLVAQYEGYEGPETLLQHLRQKLGHTMPDR
ncbi:MULTISPECIES: protein-disulfide reductase DsbD [Acidithiobacillus]|nr:MULTISPECIES: protein-disulfide reductase DsbD [Acidithiobacillus]MBE7567758.1 protein-disulfide reductase DsbD [Acidithiobacillus sp. HP-11]MBU2751636.1 protein-disulfide reductase DsbD [Acidithiobacillus thiooxidans]